MLVTGKASCSAFQFTPSQNGAGLYTAEKINAILRNLSRMFEGKILMIWV